MAFISIMPTAREAKPPTTPEDSPKDYREVKAGTGVAVQAQGNGLTATSTRKLNDKVEVLDDNQELFKNWKSFSDGGASQGVTVVEGAALRVSSSEKTGVKEQNGQLEGDAAVLNTYMAADSVHETNSAYLGREIRYRSQDGKLNIHLNAPGVGLAHYSPYEGSLVFSKDTSVGDPDAVAHETGHAIMDAVRPNLTSVEVETTGAKEGFADGIAFINALQDKEVRADFLQSVDSGKSSLAANVAEAIETATAPLDGEKPPSERQGIRDLAAEPPAAYEHPDDDGHEASRQFGNAIHDSVVDIYRRLRTEHTELSADEALSEARDIVGNDLARGLDFMHNGNETTQAELAESLMKAGRVDHQGSFQDIYTQNFQQNGLAIDGRGPGAGQAQLEALQEKLLPSAVSGGDDYELDALNPQETTVSRAASNYLRENQDALGLTEKSQLQRIYHNDRGETIIQASEYPLLGERSPGYQTAALVFDSEGQLIHLDVRRNENRTQFNQPEPTATGGGYGGAASTGGYGGAASGGGYGGAAAGGGVGAYGGAAAGGGVPRR